MVISDGILVIAFIMASMAAVYIEETKLKRRNSKECEYEKGIPNSEYSVYRLHRVTANNFLSSFHWCPARLLLFADQEDSPRGLMLFHSPSYDSIAG